MPPAYPLPLRLMTVLGALAVLAGCDARTEPIGVASKRERPVHVQRVSFETVTAARDFVGVVRARYETDLAFRVAGKITERLVNVGDRVRAGDVIARLDPQDLKLQMDSAQAELAAATSNLEQAKVDYDRYTTLSGRGFAASADVDRRKTTRDEADGRLRRAQRALDLTRNQLDYSDLKADADGVITATMAEAGQVVAIGQPVARLAHRGEKEAVVALPEIWLAQARRSDASVRLWSDSGRAFAARLRELAPAADPATRTYAARFTILDADDSVALGMTATVTQSHAADAPVVRLPLAAVLNRGSGAGVFVVNATGALELRPITIDSFDEQTVRVSAGLDAGDQVVTLGVQKLQAGLKVRTVTR